MQGVGLSPYISASHPHEHQPRVRNHKQRSQSLSPANPYMHRLKPLSRQGDWKIAGLGLTIPITKPDGSPSRWEFPTFDGRVPAYTQRSFDYIGELSM